MSGDDPIFNEELNSLTIHDTIYSSSSKRSHSIKNTEYLSPSWIRAQKLMAVQARLNHSTADLNSIERIYDFSKARIRGLALAKQPKMPETERMITTLSDLQTPKKRKQNMDWKFKKYIIQPRQSIPKVNSDIQSLTQADSSVCIQKLQEKLQNYKSPYRMQSFKRNVKLPAIDSKNGRRRRNNSINDGEFNWRKDVKPWDTEIELMPITDQEEFESNNLTQ